MARKKKSQNPPRTETYRHPTTESLLRPDVGTHAQFRKKKPHAAYRYDSSLDPADTQDGFSQYKEKDFFMKISSPERAIMEMLHLVPGKISFEEALLIMENLVSLRSDIVQRLLLICRSIKVKRLFMYMAEKQGHSWVSQLDLSKVDFGKGKRMIVPNGRYDKKYLITVPKDHYEEGFG